VAQPAAQLAAVGSGGRRRRGVAAETDEAGFSVLDWEDPLIITPWRKDWVCQERYVVRDWRALYYADDTAAHISVGSQTEVMQWFVKCARRLGIEMHVANPEPDAKGRFKSKSQFVVLPAWGREATEEERMHCYLAEDGVIYGVLPNAPGYKHLGVWHDESQSENQEARRRTRAADMAFRSMTPFVFKNEYLELGAKVKLFIAMVMPALLFGVECLVLSNKGTAILTSWYNKRVRMFLGKTKHDRLHTTALLEKIGLPPLSYFIGVRKLRWLGELQRMPFERRSRQMAFGFLRRPKCSRSTSLWRNGARKILIEATSGAAKLPAESRARLRRAVDKARAAGGIRGARNARIAKEYAAMRGEKSPAVGDDDDGDVSDDDGDADGAARGSCGGRAQRGGDGAAQRGGGGGRGGALGGARRGGGAARRGGGDGDDDDDGLVGLEAVVFSKYLMANWQIIAEMPELWEVHLTSGLEGANFDTLLVGFGRRWTPRERRARRFQDVDDLAAAHATGDPEVILKTMAMVKARMAKRMKANGKKNNNKSDK
jgi:hypothetical protein